MALQPVAFAEAAVLIDSPVKKSRHRVCSQEALRKNFYVVTEALSHVWFFVSGAGESPRVLEVLRKWASYAYMWEVYY